jgi:intracellular septation protein
LGAGANDGTLINPSDRAEFMQSLIDFIPVVIFFVVYKVYGIYPATAAIIVAMAAQIAYQWIRHRKVSKMLLFTGAVVAVLGGITLVFQDPTFIKWKPTVVSWVTAVAFLGSQFIGRKTLTERMFAQALEGEGTPPWHLFNLLWAASFAALGALNLYVAYGFEEATWVNFKVFGTMGWMVLTIALQIAWIWLWQRSLPRATASSDAGEGS